MRKFKVGDTVYWQDPDNDISSGIYKVTKIISEEIILIENEFGSEAEVLDQELTKEN